MKPTSKTTIDDVARLAGVSIKTVSRVVNGEPNVRQATQQKVNQAIRELSYVPNQSARNLASHRSRLIGLIYDDPSAFELPSPGYITRLQEGSLRACRAAQFEVLIHPCNYRNKDVSEELGRLIEQVRPAGMILAAPLSNIPEIVQSIEATGTPFVRLSAGADIDGEYSIATNDRDVCAEMTRYLASLGHKHIAFVAGHDSHKAVAQRELGYRDGLEQSGIEFRPHLLEKGDNSIGSGEACAKKLLALKDRPTAVFAANDDMAAGVLRVAMQLGIRVPEQLSIAGCDDNALCQQLHPTLTTIRQPLAAMAERAATVLIHKKTMKDLELTTEIVPAELRIRESTGPAPTE